MPRRDLPFRPFYVRVFARLWTDPRNLLLYSAGALAFALAHGAVAVCAGLLARALMTSEHAHGLVGVDPSGMLGARSGMASARLFDPTILCFVGFGAALVKAA